MLIESHEALTRDAPRSRPRLDLEQSSTDGALLVMHDGTLGAEDRPARSMKRWLEGKAIVYWALVAVFAIVALSPLIAIVIGSFTLPIPASDAQRIGTDAWQDAAHRSDVLRAIWNTVSLAVAGQLIALPLSVGISWLLGRTDLPGRRWLELGFWISFFLPVLAVLQGWVLLLDPHYGLINLGLKAVLGSGAPVLDLYSWGGIVFAHLVTTTISAKVMMMTPVFQNLDSRLEEAGQLAGDSVLKTFFRITLPLTLPIIFATAIIGLIRTLESFEIEKVLGIPKNLFVYSTLIYDLVGNDPPQFATASALGVVIVVLLSLLAILPSLVGRREPGTSPGRFVTLSSHSRTAPIRLGRWRYPAFAGVLLVVLVLTALPLTFLVMGSVMTMFGFFDLAQTWTFDHWVEVLSDSVFLSSLQNTLVLSVSAAAISVVCCTAIAYGIVSSPYGGRRLLSALSWIPSSMPGVLLSLAALWIILSNGVLTNFYGSTLSLAVVVAFSSLTFGVQLLRSNFAQISGDMEEAAWVAGASRWKALLQVIVPLSIRSIAVVAVVAFISAARSIGQLSLLVSSGNRPLAMLQLEFMSDGRYEPSAVVGVIVVALAIGAALLIRRLGAQSPV